MMNKDRQYLIKSALVSGFIFLLIILFLILCITAPTKITLAVTYGTNTVTGSVYISNTCVPVISNTAINFGTNQAPNTYVATANAENVINFGNAAANIIVDGSKWSYYSNTFNAGNTLWNPTTSGSNIGNQLQTGITGVDTLIPMLLNGGGNTIYFGVNIPAAQTPGTYTQTINIMLSC